MTLSEPILKYLSSQRALGRSRWTITNARSHLRRFASFCAGERVEAVEDVTSDLLTDYQEELSWHLTKKGRPLTARTQAEHLSTLKGFCAWLKREDYLLSDPSTTIRLPRKPSPLPRDILEVGEVKKILSSPNMRSHSGYRDRVLLEILYSTGLRRSEIMYLNVEDVDCQGGYLTVREGKGRKDRVVPLGRTASELCLNYLTSVREHLLKGKTEETALFLNRWGERLGIGAIGAIVTKYAQEARVKKHVTPHTFRHTCATHMLKGGAHIRHLQEMLGHASLESTQVYTRITIPDLKKIHAKYHPREREAEDR